jgi:PAS domain S-box-containing protein
MNLRVKLLLGIGIALIVTFALMAVFSVMTMEESYRSLEEKDIVTTLGHAGSSLVTDQKSMQSVTRDYSVWTDTYRFARGENPAWVEINTDNDFFERFNLQGVLVFNRTGGLVLAKGYNARLRDREDIPESLVAQIRDLSTSEKIPDSSEGHYLILDTPRGPVGVSSHPILKDDFGGPGAGTFHLVRWIDSRYLTELSARTENNVGIIPLPQISGNRTIAGIIAAITPGKPSAVFIESTDTITAYTPLENLQVPGRYYLRVSEPRTIYQSGQATIMTFIISLLGAGVFIIVFVLLFIDRVVLSRLNTLISTVRKNKVTGTANGIDGKDTVDELALLAREIDPVFEKLAESRMQLQQSEERYRMLAESAQDFIYIIDTDDRVAYVNSFAAAAIGRPREDIIGKPRSSLFPPPEGGRQQESIQKVFATGEPLKIESNIPLPTGERWSDTHLVPLRDRNNTITGVLGITRDLTQRKKAEDALFQANKKLNLLSSVTRHDILNQLTALRTYFEISRDYIQGGELQDLLDREEKIAEIIDRQIMFTRDYQQMGLKTPSWFNIDTILSGMILSFDTTRVKLLAECPGLEILADPLLEKVFYNLIDNAFRHGGDNLTRIRISCREAGDGLSLIIEDDGTGIPDDDKKLVFERGFGHNTGFGLFLSREILGITGMTIVETGIFGKGARFEIGIPKGAYRFSDCAKKE